ncbi:MAG: DNA-directed RNA polymerase subunit alpha [Mycoplasmataceae bacterium]|nr:DNA-directed RNA polymerase subunit alpha [Mycoplasmataceae bacterium]
MERFLIPTFNKIVSKDSLETPHIQTFTLEKLERGFANTIGVAMRRTALSSIPGVAVFAVEVNGVQHEFQSISNSKQDMVEFILNLKDLTLSVDDDIIDADEVYELTLTSKKGMVTAKDIIVPAGLQIINQDLILAETTKDKAIEAKIFVLYSKGFKIFEETRVIVEDKIGTIKGIIPIDANFSPVKRVNYIIEEVNPGESRVFEKLVLEIETDGSMKPEKAIAFAGGILKNYYKAFEELFEVKSDDLFEEEVIEESIDAQLSIPIESLNLSARSEKWLLASNIRYVQELINRPVSSLKEINNLGEKSITEIIQIVQDMGLSFKSE